VGHHSPTAALEYVATAAGAFLERGLGSPATESPAVALGKEIHFGDSGLGYGPFVESVGPPGNRSPSG
jgi:hypothetical protein